MLRKVRHIYYDNTAVLNMVKVIDRYRQLCMTLQQQTNVILWLCFYYKIALRIEIQSNRVKLYSLFLRRSYQNFAVSFGRMLHLYTANIKFVVLVEIIKVCSHFKRRYQSVEALINCHERSLYD